MTFAGNLESKFTPPPPTPPPNNIPIITMNPTVKYNGRTWQRTGVALNDTSRVNPYIINLSDKRPVEIPLISTTIANINKSHSHSGLRCHNKRKSKFHYNFPLSTPKCRNCRKIYNPRYHNKQKQRSKHRRGRRHQERRHVWKKRFLYLSHPNANLGRIRTDVKVSVKNY